MTKTFNILIKIELTEEQNTKLESLFAAISKHDVNNEVEEVYLSMADTTNGVLNHEFCPIVFLNCKTPSDELYDGIKNTCKLLPEYVHMVEELPAKAVVLWKKEK